MASSGEQPTTKLGRYELVSQIGHGGMAEVQLAVQRGPGGFEKLVVIKLVHANLAKEKTFVDMLLDEARMAALVKHPNVVDIYDLGQSDGRYYIAMEYLEGEPLLGLLRAGRDGKRLDCLSTARLIADTAEGLDAAHELQTIAGDPIELVHHDVSLGNIMVLYNGQVKLVDFGVAKASETAGPQVKVHGKFGYMAPEKLKGRGSDRRGDIWSLGVVLWEALTLRRLFRGQNEQDTMRMVIEHPIKKPSEVNKDCIPELDAVVMKALARDPDERYRRAKELAQDLEEVLRLKAYGGKNDQIAKYMQETFQAHIVARKKLLQEVMAKGKAEAGTVVAAFDEATVSDGQAHEPRYSGEFAVAFGRGRATTPPTGTPRTRAVSRQPLGDVKVDDILRRTSEEMMAEGTPHTTINMPKRATKQMFAEATPVETDPDIPPMRDPEEYDQGKYPRESKFDRMQTSPVVPDKLILAPRNTPVSHDAARPMEYGMESDAAVMAMVASLEPDDQVLAMVASLEPAHRPATPMPIVEAPDDSDEPDAAETIDALQARPAASIPPSNHPRPDSVGSLIRNQAIVVKLDDKLDNETKQQLGEYRQEAQRRNVNSMLDKLEEASGVHDVPPEGMPSRSKAISAQMRAQLQAEALARVTSQRLTVIKKPPTQVFDASAPVIVVAAEKKAWPFVLLAILAVLGIGAFAVLFFVV